MTLEYGLALAFCLLAVGLTVWACLTHDRPDEWLCSEQLPTTRVFPPDAPIFYTRDLQPEAPDALFAADPRSLAAVFGRRTIELMRRRADPIEIYRTARIAFGHAFRADPALRAEPEQPEIVLALPTPRNLHLVERVH